jgi:hypothetical protein
MAGEEHATRLRAGIAGLIIVAAIVGIAVFAYSEPHRVKRVIVFAAANCRAPGWHERRLPGALPSEDAPAGVLINARSSVLGRLLGLGMAEVP